MKMEKRQFRIGELAELIGVERFVIRFWEKEFDIKSYRSQGGQRFYKEKDVNRFQHIKKLLYDDGFTIAGAKQKLSELPDAYLASEKTTLENPPSETTPIMEQLVSLKKQLIKLKNLI